MLITTISVLSDYFNFFFILLFDFTTLFFFSQVIPKKKHIPQPLCLEGSDIKYRTICQLQQEIKMIY